MDEKIRFYTVFIVITPSHRLSLEKGRSLIWKIYQKFVI